MIISVTPRKLLKTQISGKKSNHSSEKKLLTNFSRIIEYGEPQATNYNSPQGNLTVTVEVIRASLSHKVLLETKNFCKKRQPFQ